MFKKLFFTAAAAAAVSVPLAGAAWAEPPADPGAGNKGVPDRAAAVVVSTVASIGGDPSTALDGLQSGNSTVTAPGTAFKTGAKVPGMNTPDGYAVALNEYYATHSDPVFDPGYDRLIPGQVTRTLTNNCAQHSSDVCIPPSP
jgi:hypothetical protein